MTPDKTSAASMESAETPLTNAHLKDSEDWVVRETGGSGMHVAAVREIERHYLSLLAQQAVAAPVEADAYQYRTRPTWQEHWSSWADCSKASFNDYLKTPLLHDWHYEVRALYAAPTPAEPAQQSPATLPSRIAELIEQYGSLRAASRVLECDPGYLSRLQAGEKADPGAHLLRRMGLRQITTYERT